MVTGGAGFIGSHVCRNIVESGEKVIILDNIKKEHLEHVKNVRMHDFYDKIEFIQADITKPEDVMRALKENSVKRIIHTAAITFIPTAVKNPELAFNVNTVGTFNLLEASRKLDLDKFVYISSSSTYGDFQYSPADEKHPLNPKDVYGATKAAADNMTISYFRTYGLKTNVVRTSSVYGEGDLEKRVVRNFAENALQGLPMEIHGGGTQLRDFSYVKDVANGMVLAMRSKNCDGEAFNITYGEAHTIRDMAMNIKDMIPGSDIKEVGARSIDVKRGQLSIEKARKLLNYKPKYSLKDGLEHYIDWIVNVYAPLTSMKIKNKPRWMK